MMDRNRLSQLADELRAISPRLVEEGLLLNFGGRSIGSIAPLTAAGHMIADAVEAGGLQDVVFAPFRAAVRIVVESANPDWSAILLAGEQTLPMQELCGKKHWVTTALFVAEQLDRETVEIVKKESVSKPIVPLTEAEKTILQYLNDCHPMTVTQNMFNVGAPNTVRKAIGSLTEKGLIHKPNGPRKGYGLTDTGLSLAKSFSND